MPSYQSPAAFCTETWRRLKSGVPPYWRRLQILAGGIVVMAGVMLKFQAYLTPELVPYLKHALSGSLLVAATAQLPSKEKGTPSPTADLEARLTAVLPDAPSTPDGLDAT